MNRTCIPRRHTGRCAALALAIAAVLSTTAGCDNPLSSDPQPPPGTAPTSPVVATPGDLNAVVGTWTSADGERMDVRPDGTVGWYETKPTSTSTGGSGFPIDVEGIRIANLGPHYRLTIPFDKNPHSGLYSDLRLAEDSNHLIYLDEPGKSGFTRG